MQKQMVNFAKEILSNLRVRMEQRSLSRKIRELHDEPKVIMVAMPGAPHLAVASAAHVENSELLIVANGMCDSECAALAPFCCFLLRTGSTLSHNEVIEVLINSLNRKFWLLDHDCFVLDTSLLSFGAKNPCSFGSFVFQESYGDTVIPQTFLLQLSPGAIRTFRKDFKVGIGIVKWKGLSERARMAIEDSGIGFGQYPEFSKAYFDTFRAIHFAGLSSGAGFELLRNYSASFHLNNEAIHLGGTSRPVWTEDLNRVKGTDAFWRIRYSVVGAFGWKLLAEVWNECGGSIADDFLPSSKDMLSKLMQYGYCSDEELKALDDVAVRLRSVLVDRR